MNHLHIPSSKVHFEWKVKDLQILHNYHYGDKIITLSSQTFGTGRFKWVLNIELDIRAMGHDDHLRIYLRQFDPSIEFDNLVNTKYVIYILRGETRTIISRSTFAFGTQQSLGSTLIPAARLLYAADFSLCCDIEAVTYTQLEHYGKFTDMFENGLFSDCVIRVKYQGESVKEINAHRCVLTTNEVFGTAFTTDMSEARDRVVTITDFCYETVRALVKFLYSGFIDSDILHVHFYDIYAIAHKYQVPFLMYECEKFCSSRIDNETFVIYCKIIVRYEAPILMQACASYFLVNRENFVNTNEWGEVVATYPDLSDRFLNCRDDI